MTDMPRRIECPDCDDGCSTHGCSCSDEDIANKKPCRSLYRIQCPTCAGARYLLRCDAIRFSGTGGPHYTNSCGRYVPPNQSCGKCGFTPLAWGTGAGDCDDDAHAPDKPKPDTCRGCRFRGIYNRYQKPCCQWLAKSLSIDVHFCVSDDSECPLIPKRWEAK